MEGTPMEPENGKETINSSLMVPMQPKKRRTHIFLAGSDVGHPELSFVQCIDGSQSKRVPSEIRATGGSARIA